MLTAAFCAIALAGENTHRELASYIQSARKLSIPDEQIRRNFLNAGWDSRLVDEAFASVNAPAAVRTEGSQSLPAGYRIGRGDVIQVAVWREPDASVESAVVRADGKVSIPLIKEIEVVGMTPAEAERRISERMARFINAADVTIIVREINSRRIYLVGGVKAVGSIPLNTDMTVLQAIAQSGGLTEYAKKKQIYVLRNENGRQTKWPFNYDAVIKGESVEQNIQLSPDDTIVVPQ